MADLDLNPSTVVHRDGLTGRGPNSTALLGGDIHNLSVPQRPTVTRNLNDDKVCIKHVRANQYNSFPKRKHFDLLHKKK